MTQNKVGIVEIYDIITILIRLALDQKLWKQLPAELGLWRRKQLIHMNQLVSTVTTEKFGRVEYKQCELK